MPLPPLSRPRATQARLHPAGCGGGGYRTGALAGGRSLYSQSSGGARRMYSPLGAHAAALKPLRATAPATPPAARQRDGDPSLVARPGKSPPTCPRKRHATTTRGTTTARGGAPLLKRSRRPVIFSDIDTVWLRDPRGVLSDLPISKAFAIAPETEALPQAGASFTARGGGFHVCACLFAACPSAAGEAIAEAWWHASGGENGRGNEQKAFQQMLNRQPELVVGDAAAASNYSRGGANLGRVDAVSGQFVGASMQARAESNRTRAGLLAGALADTVAILDHAHFPTGRHDRKPAPEAVWLHANWIMRKTRASTTTAKRSRMLKHGLWRPECTTAPVS